ncbi:transglutaminase-like domain-containing protein [Candidatus Vampirococcus lugosii]|uniref:Transglutaminase-like enzyme, putative cysteine protease n=1 Tax=Candidatus Vampirococcus lugosii TaxID=2789015 RepID=A0ABS5QMS4_9BACT|nr:transglutaminase-like domain-containing protein [Candidatus Vampirococcus lugosii]MBS8122382.1 Transglutaminase-like enzyme, putative cysteine protease [Candidatus Vampirococcus lugosii]
MNENILNHYLNFSVFTNPGCYENFLKSLPDDVKQLGNLISHQIIHRVTLRDLNTNANKNLIYGDMEKFPWHRLRCEDDILPNSVSMIAELLRLDDKGFHKDRKVEDKIVVTCRYVAILMATILKSKNIPCRVRSGFAPYFSDGSWDHWINQYWDQNQKKWINFDADGFFEDFLDFDQYNIPEEKFDWSANTWLGIRQGKLNADNFINAGGYKGLLPVLWAVFYDFHSLMNNEILYLQAPYYIGNKFDKFTEKDFEEIDELANLMLEVDKNFDKLVDIWNTNKKFRILNSPLIGDDDHIIWK